MLLVFSARSIAVYVCTVTQYISLWADCQQVGNDSSQHFGRWERRVEEERDGGANTHIHTQYAYTVGLGMRCLACICCVDAVQHKRPSIPRTADLKAASGSASCSAAEGQEKKNSKGRREV